MSDGTQKRRYQQRERAEHVAETRRRIAQAAAELHGTVGPARTTISAVAEHAGVGRPTVYRHFPTEADLLTACSAHFFGTNPWPDPVAWTAIADPRERLATALDQLYAYYERTGTTLANVRRDVDRVDGLAPTMVPFEAALGEAERVLATGWGARGGRARVVKATVRHVVELATWHSLTVDGGLTRAQAVALAGALVVAAASAG
jgi:AcrR family transcriptional regulator